MPPPHPSNKNQTDRCVYTIGYEGSDLDSFIKALKANKITLLCDVRHFPSSRKPGFSKTRLAKTLQDHGIAYRHYRNLGIPSAQRTPLVQTGNYKQLFAEYLTSFADHSKQNSLTELISDTARHKRFALCCFEADPERCHRTPLAEQVLISLLPEPIKLVNLAVN